MHAETVIALDVRLSAIEWVNHPYVTRIITRNLTTLFRKNCVGGEELANRLSGHCIRLFVGNGYRVKAIVLFTFYVQVSALISHKQFTNLLSQLYYLEISWVR